MVARERAKADSYLRVLDILGFLLMNLDENSKVAVPNAICLRNLVVMTGRWFNVAWILMIENNDNDKNHDNDEHNDNHNENATNHDQNEVLEMLCMDCMKHP